MINFLAQILGTMLKGVYDFISALGAEPGAISFYAIAIILTTVIFKTLLLPLNIMQTKNQLKMAEVQPEIKKIQEKYKNDPQTLATKQQQLYKETGYNPLSGCLPILIQFPVIIAFYRIFLYPTKFAFTDPAFFAEMQKNFFFISNLDKPDPSQIIMPAIAAVLTGLTSYLAQHNKTQESMSNDQTQSMMKSMMIMTPIMIFMFARNMAAGLVLYWIANSLYSLAQQAISNHLINKKAEGELK